MAFGLDEREIKDLIVNSVNRQTDQMLYLDDQTVDLVNGLAEGISEAIVKHVDKYIKDWKRDIEHKARVLP